MDTPIVWYSVFAEDLFKTLGPIKSMPEDLSGSRELRAYNGTNGQGACMHA